MKKIIATGLIALGLGMLSSCVNEVEEVFDKPASERLEERMIECQKLLTSPEHGWLIEYYPSSQQSFGGSAYTAKFAENGDVTVTGELAQTMAGDVSKTITSHYSINSSSSVVLTFDTYNDYIHYWSDPDEWSGNYFEGDFEFAYVSGDKNQMIFRGIKTDNQIVFTALKSDIVTSARQIVETQADVVDKLYLGYKWDDGKESDIVLYDDDNYGLLTYYPDGDLTGAYETIPYAYTAEGISFYKPTTIDGITVRNFKWENGAFVSQDAVTASGAATTVTLSGLHSETFIHYDKFLGTYALLYMGDKGTTMAKVEVTLKQKERYSTFALSGLGDFDIEVGYSKSDGSLSLVHQYLGKWSTYYIYLCPKEREAGGYFTWGTGIGFKLVHNGDENNLVLTFEDNGVWGTYVATGFDETAFTSMAPSAATSAGYYDRFEGLKTMTKK